MLVPIFASLPHIPENWKRVITKIIAPLSLLFGILGLIGLLGTGALVTIFSPFAAIGKGFLGLVFFFNILLSLITSVLSIMAYRPLQSMHKKGWNYIFYSLVISAVCALLSLLSMYGGVGNIIVILLVSYLLFEIREKYSK